MWVCCYQNCSTLHTGVNCTHKSFALVYSHICRDNSNAKSDIFCDMYACMKKKIMAIIFPFYIGFIYTFLRGVDSLELYNFS